MAAEGIHIQDGSLSPGTFLTLAHRFYLIPTSNPSPLSSDLHVAITQSDYTVKHTQVFPIIGHALTFYALDAPKNALESQSELPTGALNGSPDDSGRNDASHDQAAESKATEEPKPAEQNSGATTVNSQESLTEDKSGHLQTGDKREHDSATAPPDTDKSIEEDTNMHQEKRQKTNKETAKPENGAPTAPVTEDKAPVSETNGEKKKLGRPKRTLDPVKKAIPTDGIGSRTRSRTKAT